MQKNSFKAIKKIKAEPKLPTATIEVVKMKQPKVKGWLNIYEGTDLMLQQRNDFTSRAYHSGHVHFTQDQADRGAEEYYRLHHIKRLYCIKIDLK